MTFHDHQSDTGAIPPGMIDLVLPYPPSVNGYWRHVAIQGKPRVLISAEGREYRRHVCNAVLLQKHRKAPPGRLFVTVVARPPDRRTRDLDNIGKGLLDALVHAGVMVDDGLIDRLTFIRGDVIEGGAVYVRIGGNF